MIEKRYPELLGRLMSVVRATSALNAQDVGFQRTLDSAFAQKSQQVSDQLLELINEILQKGGRDLALESVGDVKHNWNAIQNTFDRFVDRTKAVTGEPGQGPQPSKPRASSPAPASPSVTFYDKTIAKPQTKFSTPVDNSYGPFKPLLADKPWATLSLNESIAEQPKDEEHEDVWHEHPYKQEILGQYPSFVYEKGTTKFPKDREPVLVQDRKALSKMIKDLKKHQQIAVDLEHHDYRTYLGLVCLMQISSPNKDYIVDTLALRDELQELNCVFCNPNILKVLHGAFMDVLWLQRDLGLYLVGLFDTSHAARALNFPKKSLAYLLEHYCQFTADKKYQMADWRMRPLTAEMQAYAQADTHYLLYIADQMRNELLEKDLMGDVLQNSRETASKRYEKPEYNVREPGWWALALKSRIDANDHVLEALYKWRDAKARELDESPRYVMSPQSITKLVRHYPQNIQHVMQASPSLNREYAAEVLELVQVASKLPPRPQMFKTRRVDLFDKEEVAKSSSMRLATASLFVREPAAHAPPAVNLSLIPEMAAPVQAEASSSESESESESSSSSESELEPEPEPVTRKSSKRKINIVEGQEELELKPTQKKKRAVEDAEAFDFDTAAPVMKEAPQQRKQYQKRGKQAGPAKKRNARNAAKTVTYRK